MKLEERVNELESRLAFQDDMLQSLNDSIFEQQKIIDLLSRKLDALIKLYYEKQPPLQEQGQEPPPPHY